MRMRIFVAALVLLFSGGMSVADRFDEPMTFARATSGGNCVNCQWISAEGVIQEGTAERFLEFLAREDLLEARGLNIHLHSPGGNLVGGVLLGLVIRNVQANTVVSATPIDSFYRDGTILLDWEADVAAECSSACVFAFAGGVSRFASGATPGFEVGFQRTGRLGVHQFYNPADLSDPDDVRLTAEDRIADQRLIALLLAYLSDMGVSAELLQLAALTDPRDMHYLTEEQLRSTRIDNRMVKEVEIVGYRNGVAIVEIRFARSDADYRIELYCKEGDLHMLSTVDWRGEYDAASHRQWNLLENVKLKDGPPLDLLSSEFGRRQDGGVSGKFRFRFAGASARELVQRRDFFFEDWSSRYANNAAAAMGFRLPAGFDGLYLLPKTCM